MGLLIPIEGETAVSVYCFKDFKPRGQVWPWSMIWWFLTGQLERWTGYIVSVDAALGVLEARDTEAAAWWHENAAHLRGATFIFPLESCEPA